MVHLGFGGDTGGILAEGLQRGLKEEEVSSIGVD